MRDPVSIHLLSGDPKAEPVSYRVADGVVICNPPIEELEPLRTTRAVIGSAPPAVEHNPPPGSSRIFSDRGWVGGSWTEVECFRAEAGYWISVEGTGSFFVSADGRWILEIAREREAMATTAQAVLGPCLCLSLALQGVFCLHAAGALQEDRAYVFAGLSGGGKSTLVSYLGDQEGLGWRRLADDILPVGGSAGSWRALPHFPQLKLEAEAQWRPEAIAAVPLEAVFIVSLLAPEAELDRQRLSPREATVALLRHTVAGRLFDADLAARHLKIVGRIAAEVPIYELSVPRRRDALEEVSAVLHQ